MHRNKKPAKTGPAKTGHRISGLAKPMTQWVYTLGDGKAEGQAGMGFVAWIGELVTGTG